MTITPQSPSQLQKLAQHVLAMPMAKTRGLSFTRIAPGDIEVEIPILDAFSFRPAQLQGTPVCAVADFAAIAAAGTVLLPGRLNATVDATIKLMAPGTWHLAPGTWRFAARARSRRARWQAADHLCGRCVCSQRQWPRNLVRYVVGYRP